MNDEKEMNSIWFNRAKIFFDRKLEVHISANRNGFSFFYNGLIKEINPKFMILEERKLGEVPIQFSEIYDIEKFVGRDYGYKKD